MIMEWRNGELFCGEVKVGNDTNQDVVIAFPPTTNRHEVSFSWGSKYNMTYLFARGENGRKLQIGYITMDSKSFVVRERLANSDRRAESMDKAKKILEDTFGIFEDWAL